MAIMSYHMNNQSIKITRTIMASEYYNLQSLQISHLF